MKNQRKRNIKNTSEKHSNTTVVTVRYNKLRKNNKEISRTTTCAAATTAAGAAAATTGNKISVNFKITAKGQQLNLISDLQLSKCSPKKVCSPVAHVIQKFIRRTSPRK
jgi:hypothetical protein